MVRSGAAEAPTAASGEGVLSRVFHRATPQDALDLAHATFLSGARVEMGALTARLGISQPTLYRWVGTREQLLDAVLGRVADEFLAVARAEAEGDGDERVLDFVRRTMSITATLEPALAFIGREPQLALRLVLGHSGSVHRSLARELAKVIGETRPASEAKTIDGRVDLMVEVCTGLQWTAIAIGDTPHIDGAVEVVRGLLRLGNQAPG